MEDRHKREGVCRAFKNDGPTSYADISCQPSNGKPNFWPEIELNDATVWT